jgi:hypothetical protein
VGKQYNDLEQEIARRYPYPLSATYYRAFRAARSGIESHDYLLNLFEVALKYCASIAISQYFSDERDDTQISESLRSIRRPSIGHWHGWLRDILSLYRQRNQQLLVPELQVFFTRKQSGDVLQAYTSLHEVQRTQPKNGAITLEDLFSLLVQYRNKVMHGPRPSVYDLADAAPVLKLATREIFRNLDFTADYPLIYLEKIEKAPGSFRSSRRYDHYYTDLMGDRYSQSPQPKTLDNDNAEPMSLYLLAKDEVFRPLLSLDPLFIFQFCPQDRRDEVFVLNDSDERRVDYISYQCTHHFRPTESLDRIQVLLSRIGILQGDVLGEAAVPAQLAKAPDGQHEEPEITEQEPDFAEGHDRDASDLILSKYRELGGPASFLRDQLGSVQRSPHDSSQGTRYTFARFVRGFICLHESGPRSGQIFTANGGIYEKFWKMGGPQSVLGLPIRNEDDAYPSGISGYKARYSLFENGVIHWHAEGPKLDQSFEMHGAIADKYNNSYMGGKCGSGSFLGLPVTNQAPGATSSTGVRCEFVACEAGAIHLHLDGPLQGQVFETHGAIWFAYAEMGGSGSGLGLPVSDEYDWKEGRRSDFERGYVYWHRASDTVDAVPYS